VSHGEKNIICRNEAESVSEDGRQGAETPQSCVVDAISLFLYGKCVQASLIG
jgi:hypothetical protein